MVCIPSIVFYRIQVSIEKDRDRQRDWLHEIKHNCNRCSRKHIYDHRFALETFSCPGSKAGSGCLLWIEQYTVKLRGGYQTSLESITV